MTFPPDFDKLARGIAVLIGSGAPTRQTVGDALVKVWNERGDADKTAISLKATELSGTASDQVCAEHFDRAIAALDAKK